MGVMVNADIRANAIQLADVSYKNYLASKVKIEST